MDKPSLKVGRLTKGTGYTGPEYFGCCGTGQRPCIRRARTFAGVTSLYLVGPQYECETVLQSASGAKWYFSSKRSIKIGTRTVWKFRSRRAALAKFDELCEVVYAYNRKERARQERARQMTKSSDPVVALQGALMLD